MVAPVPALPSCTDDPAGTWTCVGVVEPWAGTVTVTGRGPWLISAPVSTPGWPLSPTMRRACASTSPTVVDTPSDSCAGFSTWVADSMLQPPPASSAPAVTTAERFRRREVFTASGLLVRGSPAGGAGAGAEPVRGRVGVGDTKCVPADREAGAPGRPLPGRTLAAGRRRGPSRRRR